MGRVTTMASYAMVYTGAPIFFWRWAIAAAVFVSNITATYYSRERIWSTPTPWSFGALVLLDKDARSKFQARCALLIFLHYAFFSPRSKRVIFRQDAIFLVTTFPMRSTRTNSGLPPDGEPLIAVRSPLALDSLDDFNFNIGQLEICCRTSMIM